MSADPINRAMLDGTLHELHQLWCEDPDPSHDDSADPERAAMLLALGIWDLQSAADENPAGVAASALDLLAAFVAAQYAPVD